MKVVSQWRCNDCGEHYFAEIAVGVVDGLSEMTGEQALEASETMEPLPDGFDVTVLMVPCIACQGSNTVRFDPRFDSLDEG